MKLNLRGKFLIPTILFIFIAIAFLGFESYWTASKVLQSRVSGDLVEFSDMMSDQVELWSRDIIANLSSQATRRDVRDFLTAKKDDPAETEAMNDMFAEQIKFFRGYDGLNIHDLGGKVIASSNKDAVGLDLSDRGYYKSVKQTNKPVFSNVVSSKRDGTPIFVCILPVFKDGSTVGYISAVISCTDFSKQFVLPLKIGDNGYAFITDKTGLVFAHPKNDMIMKVNLNDFDWGKSIIEKKHGVELYNFNGHEKMVYYNNDDLTGWYVAVCASVDDIKDELATIRNTALIVGVVTIIILGVILIWLMTNLVTSPINIIVDFMKRSSVGDTSSNKKYADKILSMYKRGDEIGVFTKAAGGMRMYIDQKVREAQRIADGDFTAKIVVASEKDNLGKAFNDMKQKLNHTIRSVSELVHQVNIGADQFAAASESLSSGATQTAASLEEINSSIVEIGSQTKLNAENAGEANGLASDSKVTADKGNTDVEEMVLAMVDMQESGQEIAKIVKMIDDIAFQTNLLSLNAAVEAARAGRHGKGFAVVAEEVRNLAGRSAKAAKETAELVDETVSKLANGAKIAHNTQESLNKVVGDVVKVADLLGEISTASTEQAEGISQISTGLQQIDKVTQNNTSNAEETLSAANLMAERATQLNELMAQFNLEDEGKEVDSAVAVVGERKPRKKIPASRKPKMIELDD